MNGQRVALLVVSVAGMVGTFLPWATGPGGTATGTNTTGGLIPLGLLAVPLLAALAGDRAKELTFVLRLGAFFFGGAAAAFAILNIVALRNATGPLARIAIEVGPGLYLIAGAGGLVFLFGLVFSGPKRPEAVAGGAHAVASHFVGNPPYPIPGHGPPAYPPSAYPPSAYPPPQYQPPQYPPPHHPPTTGYPPAVGPGSTGSPYTGYPAAGPQHAPDLVNGDGGPPNAPPGWRPPQ